MIKLGASVVTMNHLKLNEEIQLLEEVGGVDYLHLDVMDGNFVPRYGIYPEIIHELSKASKLPLDVHLMVSDVEFALKEIAHIDNIKTVSFHYFTNEGRIFKLVDAIKDIGAKPILTIDLSVPLSDFLPLVESEELNGLLFMGIHPGVLKQTHRPKIVLKKLEELERSISIKEDFILQIDGGFNFETAAELARAGINSFVGGSSSIYKNVMGADNKDCRLALIKENIRRIRELVD